VPASDYRALQNQIRELQCLLGKKPLEAEIFNTVGDPVRSVQGQSQATSPSLQSMRQRSWRRSPHSQSQPAPPNQPSRSTQAPVSPASHKRPLRTLSISSRRGCRLGLAPP
jgi:hypothetical protein